LCVADTVGHATPNGARAVVGYVKALIDELGVTVGIDWHGHRDRGFGVASSIAALEAGATRLHGAALGIGERCGNTPIDLLMVNLVMMGYRDNDLSTLPAYAQAVARACDVRIAPNYPVVGADAFRTATGVHAAAVVKAYRKHDRPLMDAVYAAVPASLVGREQEIEVARCRAGQTSSSGSKAAVCRRQTRSSIGCSPRRRRRIARSPTSRCRAWLAAK